jgi:hypothetical protein
MTASLCGPVAEFLAEAQVPAVLAGADPLPEDGIARRADGGYTVLVSHAARLPGWARRKAGDRGTHWRLAG